MKGKKNDREKNVDRALAISSLDAVKPSEDCLRLLDKYSKGNIGADEVTKKLIEKYKAD